VARQPDTARSAVLVWNGLGLADLVVGVSLGALSAPGSIRMFFGDPSSALIASLPWVLIPCFLVPSLSFVHLIVFYRNATDEGSRRSERSSVIERRASRIAKQLPRGTGEKVKGEHAPQIADSRFTSSGKQNDERII